MGKIINLLKPFIIWRYNNLLFKYDSKYKAISSEIDNIFKNNFFILEDNIKNYFKNNIKIQNEITKQPDSIKKYLIKFKNFDFDKYSEIDEKIQIQIKENIFLKLFIEKYITSDKKIINLFKKFENSILWFRSVFDLELANFYSWKKVNSSSLELHKKIILNSLHNLLLEADKKIYFIINNLYIDFFPHFIKNPNIDSIKLENLHQSINQIYENTIKKENFNIYIYLEDYIEKSLSDIITLLVKK